MVVIGLDLGGSTTKAVAMDEDKILGFASIKASDHISAASGALGKILYNLEMKLVDVTKVAATGVGSFSIPNRFLGVETVKVDEITSIGSGGVFLSKKKRALVVSIGTGTAMVAVDKDKNFIKHVGGTGIGGGTLFGLGKALLNKDRLDTLIELAKKGNIRKVDLTVGELAGKSVGILSETVTASNFGKINDRTEKEDLALGLFNLVGQVIGTLSVFAAKAYGLIRDIVYVGGLTKVELFSKPLLWSTNLFGGKALIPRNSDYCTAIGAALAAKKGE